MVWFHLKLLWERSGTGFRSAVAPAAQPADDKVRRSSAKPGARCKGGSHAERWDKEGQGDAEPEYEGEESNAADEQGGADSEGGEEEEWNERQGGLDEDEDLSIEKWGGALAISSSRVSYGEDRKIRRGRFYKDCWPLGSKLGCLLIGLLSCRGRHHAVDLLLGESSEALDGLGDGRCHLISSGWAITNMC